MKCLQILKNRHRTVFRIKYILEAAVVLNSFKTENNFNIFVALFILDLWNSPGHTKTCIFTLKLSKKIYIPFT